ncbi:MAG: sulfurtransferase [Pseudomonadota bacterium]
MPAPFLPLIVEPNELDAALGGKDLLVVDLGEEAVYAQRHVPGAVHLPYRTIIEARPPAGGLLPDDIKLGAILSSVGITPSTHVVAYDSEGNAKACRLLWTLEVVGHAKYSLLNGGLHAWLAEGKATEGGINRPPRGDYKIGRHTEARADKGYILARLDDPGVVILDTRTPAEFTGQDVRAARGGHIPRAVNMDWTLAIDRARALRLRPDQELRALLEGLGVTPDKEVIAHCQTHHRSSHTFIVLKALGYPRVRGYDGSWSEWGNDPALPVES